MLIQVSENDPFLLDETETARCVEVCRAYLIEGAPSGTLAEELARSWINVVGETLQRRRQKAAATSTRARRCSELCTCIPNTSAEGGQPDDNVGEKKSELSKGFS